MQKFLPLWVISLLLLATEVLAQEPAGAVPPAPSFGELLSKMMPMFVVVFLIFYFMVLRPQQAKIKAQADLLAALKPGDNVVTTGGIIGKVVKSEQDFILIEVANNVKIKVEPSHVTKKLEKGGSEKSAS